MNTEIEYRYPLDTSMMDRFGGLTPCGYQRIIMVTTEQELKRLNMDIPTLISNYGISWILLSLSVEIENAILPGEVLKIKTNHTWQKGVLYRRDFAFFGEDGSLKAKAVTFSSLFDIKKRRIVMDREIYKKISLPEDEELFSAIPKCAVSGEFKNIDKVAVRPCWIDALGHVNNFRYGELVLDALSGNEKYRERLSKLKRLEIFFTAELKEGENVLLKVKDEDNIFSVNGEHEVSGKSAFLARLFF